MPFSRPTLSELRQQTAADINAALPGVDARLRYSNLGIIADLLAALSSGHYGYIDWTAKQQVPFTATDEFLEGWAALKDVTRKPATGASGAATFTATDGKVIPAGTAMNRADGVTYVTTAEATAAGGSVTAPIAASDTGATTNAVVGVALTLGVGISGISSTGVVSAAVAGGADIETSDELRSRMLAAYANPPQGGSKADYLEWATSVPGVTRAWVTPLGMGPGTVVIYFMMDDAEAAHGGFPQGTDGVAANETRDVVATGDQFVVANAIFEKQPVTPLVYAVAPLPNTIDITIAGIPDASTATRTAINAAIDAALLSGAVPGGTTNVSAIEAAIAGVAGTAGFVITEIVASAGSVTPGSAGNIVSNAGCLPVRGAVSYA